MKIETDRLMLRELLFEDTNDLILISFGIAKNTTEYLLSNYSKEKLRIYGIGNISNLKNDELFTFFPQLSYPFDESSKKYIKDVILRKNENIRNSYTFGIKIKNAKENLSGIISMFSKTNLCNSGGYLTGYMGF
jgi:hypothetical protein